MNKCQISSAHTFWALQRSFVSNKIRLSTLSLWQVFNYNDPFAQFSLVIDQSWKQKLDSIPWKLKFNFCWKEKIWFIITKCTVHCLCFCHFYQLSLACSLVYVLWLWSDILWYLVKSVFHSFTLKYLRDSLALVFVLFPKNKSIHQNSRHHTSLKTLVMVTTARTEIQHAVNHLRLNKTLRF